MIKLQNKQIKITRFKNWLKNKNKKYLKSLKIKRQTQWNIFNPLKIKLNKNWTQKFSKNLMKIVKTKFNQFSE